MTSGRIIMFGLLGVAAGFFGLVVYGAVENHHRSKKAAERQRYEDYLFTFCPDLFVEKAVEEFRELGIL